MKLTINEILLNYGVPLLVRAKSETQGDFIGINYSDPEDGTACSFYFVRPRPKYYRQFCEQKIDLRYLIVSGSYSKKFHGLGFGNVGELIRSSRYEGELSEEMLPAPRLFNPNPIPAASSVVRRKISIDGRWDVNDLSLFSDLVRDCYSFTHAIIEGTTDRLQQTFEHYPWRGGSSSLNFFRDLSGVIAANESVKLTKMQYASPGFIEFSLRDDVAHLIRELVEDIKNPDSAAKKSYLEARSYLRERKLLTISKDDVPAFSVKQQEEMLAILTTLSNDFGLSAYQENIMGLSRNDVLAGIKILLAFYRRLSKFADYSATGKAAAIFE